MSRQRAWTYTTRLDLFDGWEGFYDFFEDCCGSVYPDACCQGGYTSGTANEAAIYLWANKTRARRIGDALDRIIGEPGRLERLAP